MSCSDKKQGFWNQYEESLKNKDYQNAILNLDNIISEDSNSDFGAKAQYSKGNLYQSYVHNYDLAIKEYDKVIKNYPNSIYVSDAHFLKCFILNNNVQKYTDAIICYEEFISNYPDSNFIDDAQSELKELSGQKTVIDSLINNNK